MLFFFCLVSNRNLLRSCLSNITHGVSCGPRPGTPGHIGTTSPAVEKSVHSSRPVRPRRASAASISWYVSASCAAVPPCDGAGEGIPLETSGFPWHIHNFQSETAAALVPALLCSLIREVVDSPSPMHSRSSRAAARVAAAHCEPAAHPGMAGLNSHCTTRSVLHSNLTGSSAGGGSSASDGSSCPMHPSTLSDVSVAPGGRHTAIPPGGLFSPPGSDSKCGQGQNISVHSREKIHFTLAEVLYTRI